MFGLFDYSEDNVCDNYNLCLNLSIDSNNSSFCGSIKDDFDRGFCLENYNFNFFLNQSLVEKDVNICDKIESLDFQNMCRDTFYFSNSDINESNCDLIINEVLRKNCLLNIS